MRSLLVEERNRDNRRVYINPLWGRVEARKLRRWNDAFVSEG